MHDFAARARGKAYLTYVRTHMNTRKKPIIGVKIGQADRRRIYTAEGINKTPQARDASSGRKLLRVGRETRKKLN